LQHAYAKLHIKCNKLWKNELVKIKRQHGFAAVEAVIVVVVLGLIGCTGWYVWHGSRVRRITGYNDCIKAGGQRVDPTVIGAESDCKIYGMTYTDAGKVNWEVGQRYTPITHKANLPPATITDKTGGAPSALITVLKQDNGECAVGNPSPTPSNRSAFVILKVVDDKYALLNYGCDTAASDSYMITVNTTGGWRETSPTNQFTNSGVPSCALVNYFAVSKALEPACWVVNSKQQRVMETNRNP
jgi:hypothetical protein